MESRTLAMTHGLHLHEVFYEGEILLLLYIEKQNWHYSKIAPRGGCREKSLMHGAVPRKRVITTIETCTWCTPPGQLYRFTGGGA